MYSRTISRVATGLVATALAAGLLAAPAQAADADVNEVIRSAESASADAVLFDDITAALPVSSGAGVNMAGLDVTFDGGSPTSAQGELLVSTGAGVTYTADQLDEGTVRMSAILESERSRASWTFRGAELQQFDGVDTISVVKGDEFVGVIEAPWAVDANGVELSTHYEVRGPKLIQIVETDANTAFPVVADPTTSLRWWGTVISFNRNESIGIVGTTTTCAAALSKAKIPHLRNIAWACGILSAINAGPLATGRCIRVNAYFSGQMTPWWGTC